MQQVMLGTEVAMEVVEGDILALESLSKPEDAEVSWLVELVPHSGSNGAIPAYVCLCPAAVQS